MYASRLFAPLYTGIVLSLALLGAACETSVEGSIAASGRTVLRVQTALAPQMSSLLRKLGGDDKLLDAAAFTNSVKTLRGVQSAAFTQKNPSTVHGEITIRAVDDVLPPKLRSIIRWRQSAAGGSARITINRENGPELIAALSPEFVDYLSTLMAPLATGEALTQAEYLELVESVYGAPLAREIKAARFTLRLELPAALSAVSGGTASGSSAVFSTALIDLLVLENPVVYEMNWGS